MNEKIDTLKEIEKILGEYYKRAASMHVDELLDLRDKLAIHSYRLAEYTADAKTSYNTNYFNRKITVNRSQQALMQKQNMSAAKSLINAEICHEDALQDELIAEALAYKHDLLLKQTNKVLDAMNQRISHVKNELEQSKHQQ